MPHFLVPNWSITVRHCYMQIELGKIIVWKVSFWNRTEWLFHMFNIQVFMHVLSDIITYDKAITIGIVTLISIYARWNETKHGNFFLCFHDSSLGTTLRTKLWKTHSRGYRRVYCAMRRKIRYHRCSSMLDYMPSKGLIDRHRIDVGFPLRDQFNSNLKTMWIKWWSFIMYNSETFRKCSFPNQKGANGFKYIHGIVICTVY